MDLISLKFRALSCRFVRLKAGVSGRKSDSATDVSTDGHAKTEVKRMGRRPATAASEVPPMTAGERR